MPLWLLIAGMRRCLNQVSNHRGTNRNHIQRSIQRNSPRAYSRMLRNRCQHLRNKAVRNLQRQRAQCRLAA